MAITLQLTDGTTTINLVDTTGINVLRQNWSPQIAARRDDRRAGICPYEDVVETISFSVTGTSTSNLLSKIEALISLLDKVRDWQEDDTKPAVSIVYSPNGASDTCTAVVVDLPDGWLNMPSEFEFGVGTAVFLQPVTIQIVRRGLWYTGFAEGNGSSATEPALHTSTWTGAQTLHGPIKIEITGGTGVDDGGTPLNSYGYFVYTVGATMAASGPEINVIDANTFTGSGFTSSSAGSNAGGLGGAVMRATAASSSTKTLSYLSALSGVAPARQGRYNVLIRTRNTSSTVSWVVNYEVGYNSTGRGIQSRSVIIGTDNNDPQIVNLGSVYSYNMYAFGGLRINAYPTIASGSGHAFEIDAVCIFEVTDHGGAIYLERINYFQGSHTLVIDPKFVDGQQGWIGNVSGSVQEAIPYKGDLWISTKDAERFSFSIFGVTEGEWRLKEGDVSGSPTNYTYDASLSIYETTLVPT